ncbi:hypothetical protein PFISCL1PPCAC_13385, partial [Pristionchus fissidentatus]
LLSTLAILCFTFSDASRTKRDETESRSSEELLREISVEAVIISTWWEEGTPIHQYEVRIQNDSPVSICRVKVRINGHMKQFWNLETYKGAYRTPYWLALRPGAFSSQPGFISRGQVDLKL